MSYEDDKVAAVNALAHIDPSQPFGTELFNAIALRSISIGYEAVKLRENYEKLEVLMTQRGGGEAYAGEWHCPGGIVRPGDSDQQVFDRLAEKEFKAPVISWKFAGVYDLPKEARGHFKPFVFLVETGNVHAGSWFEVSDLPDTTIAHHRELVIPIAVEFFQTGKVVYRA